MKTILIPVDFTSTSDNASEFALAWCRHFEFDHVILLRTFYNSIFENVLPTTEYININQEHRKTEMDMLQQWKQEFTDRLEPAVQVSVAVSEKSLLRSIIEVLENEKVELIVLGSDHFSHSNNSFISSRIVEIARASPANVLIVPSVCKYKTIQKILIPFDMESVGILEKLEGHGVKSIHWHDKKLILLNVDPEEKYLLREESFEQNENSLHSHLKNFRHEIHYSNDESILTGILNFLDKHPVDLIVALPGRHSFLYSLTHKSISEALYRDGPKPVLILK